MRIPLLISLGLLTLVVGYGFYCEYRYSRSSTQRFNVYVEGWPSPRVWYVREKAADKIINDYHKQGLIARKVMLL